ncbi:MAG: hypothetical protein AB7R90_14820 [Reyranellaceae bacterium]
MVGVAGWARFLRVREKDNVEFWVAQAVIVLATVLGVYLAAQTGFAQAVRFERMMGDKDGYHLRSALLEEFRDNLDQAEQWGKAFTGGQAQTFFARGGRYELQTFVWEAMRFSKETFQVPAASLTAIRRYYRDAAANLQRMRQADREARPAAEALLADTAQARQAILPLLEKDREALKRRLEKAGMELD